MKNIIYAILIELMFFSLVQAQEKYLIYFKDKGHYNKESLRKISNIESFAENYISQKSIERRKKNGSKEIFKFEDLPLEENYLNILKENKIQVVNKLKWFNAVSAWLDEGQVDFLQSLDFIEKVEKIRKKKFRTIENTIQDENLFKNNTKSNIFDYGASLTQNQLSDIPKVHEMGFTGKGVIIGLLDTGFDWETPKSLKNRNVIAEYDFIFQDNNTANEVIDPSSQHSHGTSVFSIIAGFDEGKLIGPAFDAEFVLAKTEFVPSETHAEEDNYAAALEWMDSIGVDITSSSLGYSEFDDSVFSYTYDDMDGKTTIVTKAAEMAFDRGIFVITSAGNEGNSPWQYITAPGDGFNTLTIGAVSSSNVVASFSSRGPTSDGRIKPDVVAQGVSVVNARAGLEDSYSSGSGTSFSAPISAGVAGLLLSAYPHLTNQQVRSIFLESGDNVDDPNNDIGYGLISALRAITYPNLKQVGSNFIINKILNNNTEIDSNSVELIINGVTTLKMNKSKNIFSVGLPILKENQTYNFYFSYKDLAGNTFREPFSKNYSFKYGKPFVDLVLTDVQNQNKIPDDYFLSQNYPNPFNPTTIINYSIPNITNQSGERVTLKIFNVLGNEIKTLVDEVQQPGNYSISFTSDNLASGVYFYQLWTPNFSQTKRMLKLK